MEIKRDRYLKQLIESRKNGFIKVVTGIRRCGKSYLLNVLFYHYLLDKKILQPIIGLYTILRIRPVSLSAIFILHWSNKFRQRFFSFYAKQVALQMTFLVLRLLNVQFLTILWRYSSCNLTYLWRQSEYDLVILWRQKNEF